MPDVYLLFNFIIKSKFGTFSFQNGNKLYEKYFFLQILLQLLVKLFICMTIQIIVFLTSACVIQPINIKENEGKGQKTLSIDTHFLVIKQEINILQCLMHCRKPSRQI